MATSLIGRIAKRAKAIRKQNPKIEWRQAIKKASIELKGKKKVGATLLLNKGETRRTKPKRVYMVKRTKAGTYSGTQRIAGMPIVGKVSRSTSRKKVTVSSTLNKAKGMILEKIGEESAKQFKAKLKRDKKKIGKKIAALKSQYRKL